MVPRTLANSLSIAVELGGVELSSTSNKSDHKQRDPKADVWKQAFISVPYLRDEYPDKILSPGVLFD